MTDLDVITTATPELASSPSDDTVIFGDKGAFYANPKSVPSDPQADGSGGTRLVLIESQDGHHRTQPPRSPQVQGVERPNTRLLGDGCRQLKVTRSSSTIAKDEISTPKSSRARVSPAPDKRRARLRRTSTMVCRPVTSSGSLLSISSAKSESDSSTYVFSRALEDKRPRLADLRESGAQEQDADIVVLLYRDEYYHPERTEKPGVGEVIIAKNCNGSTTRVELAFVASQARWANLG